MLLLMILIEHQDIVFPNLHDTYELLSKKYEEKNIRQLMYDNPLAIINGKEVLPVQVKKLSLFKRRK